jgi:hypothetical protein
MDRISDKLYCTEMANQAVEAWFDRTWEQIEPMLAGAWDHGTHAMPWDEARGFVKSAWTDGLERGARELNAGRAPRAAAPCDRPATH